MTSEETVATTPVRVLVVDDDEDTGALLGLFLSHEGWDITLASGVLQARAALAKTNFSALVTDVNLPDGNGLTLLEAGRSPHLRAAVVLTGSRNETERQRSEDSGFDAYFVKPVDGGELVLAMTRLLFSNVRDVQ